jgi:hypothetical protein
MLSTQMVLAENKKSETEDSIAEFKETKFLQIDPFEIPKELKVIENQIAQNTFDVIILTGKYTLSYSEKRPEGYNKNYRNFFGLKISILPLKENASDYVVKLLYYNWTTNKYDKTLTKKISKYNILNEMRFAMYELILGPAIVNENRDIIERKNFERIQAVRQTIEEQEKREKQKKKQKKEALEKKQEKPEAKPDDEMEEEKLKREAKKKEEKKKDSEEKEEEEGSKSGRGKAASGNAGDPPELEEPELKSKKNNPSSEKTAKKKVADKKAEEKKTEPFLNSASIAPELEKPDPPTPKTIAFNLNAGLRIENVEAIGLIQTKTNLNYLNLGADYRTDMLAKYPWGYGFSLNAGIPVKKEKYQISVSRALEGGVFKTFYSNFRVGGGFEYSSLVFANLAGAGEGLKIVQNDLLYGKLKFSLQFNLLNREMLAGAEFSTSLSQKSDINKAISVTKNVFFYQAQIKGDHSAELRVSQSTFTGYFSGKASGVAVLYVYNFGN